MSQDLEVYEATDAEIIPAATGLFAANNPIEFRDRVKETAAALVDVVEARELYTMIGEKKHIEVTAWTFLGSMLGVFPVVEWTKQLSNGWEARAVAQTRTGQVVGSAEAECRFSESSWKSKPSYALRSMAQTRARRNALASALGFIVELAGYSPKLVEEAPVRAVDHARLHAYLKDLADRNVAPPDKFADWNEYSRHRANELFGASRRTELTIGQMNQLIDDIAEAAIPF